MRTRGREGTGPASKTHAMGRLRVRRAPARRAGAARGAVEWDRPRGARRGAGEPVALGALPQD